MTSVARNNVVALNYERHEQGAACQTCSRGGRCPAAGRPEALGLVGQPMQRVVKGGRVVFEAGSQFEGVYVVRAGFFKSYTVDADGTMQVTGFHLPGEFFGMDGLEDGRHREFVQALDTSSICRIPIEALSEPSASPGGHEWSSHMTLALLKLMSSTIQRDRATFLAFGKATAKGRLSSFLASLSERMAAGGYSGTQFRLCMSRTDIANHLCLALETVSRLFTQLQAEGVIEVAGRELRIKDLTALRPRPLSGAAEAAS